MLAQRDMRGPSPNIGAMVEIGYALSSEEHSCGPDPAPIRDIIDRYAQAGYTHVYLHQVGPDQQGFIDFAKRELLGVPAAAS